MSPAKAQSPSPKKAAGRLGLVVNPDVAPVEFDIADPVGGGGLLYGPGTRSTPDSFLGVHCPRRERHSDPLAHHARCRGWSAMDTHLLARTHHHLVGNCRPGGAAGWKIRPMRRQRRGIPVPAHRHECRACIRRCNRPSECDRGGAHRICTHQGLRRVRGYARSRGRCNIR